MESKFRKSLKSAQAAAKHAWKNIGFKKADPGDTYACDRYYDGKRNFARGISSLKYKNPKGAL